MAHGAGSKSSNLQCGLVFSPRCAVCKEQAARIEIVLPHARPVDWPTRKKKRRAVYTKWRDATKPYLLYEGPGGENGLVGDPLSVDEMHAIVTAFTAPYLPKRFARAGVDDCGGFCVRCRVFYCPRHWNISATGGGTCPKGHFQGLDPHWSPE